jgi:hypothetical protein
MPHLGSPISAKVYIRMLHWRSLLTDANVTRSLGEILYRSRQGPIGLSDLRDRWPCGRAQSVQGGRAELEPEFHPETWGLLKGMAHGPDVQ